MKKPQASAHAAATLLLAAVLAAVCAPGALAQDKPTLTSDDYGQWESLGQTVLSRDGRWLAVGVARVNDEG